MSEKEYLTKEALAVKFLLFTTETSMRVLKRGFFDFMNEHNRSISLDESGIWIGRAKKILQGETSFVNQDTVDIVKKYLNKIVEGKYLLVKRLERGDKI